MKVYVVTTGQHSDYRIEGIFSTIENAKEAIGLINSEECNEIEEFELDPKIDGMNIRDLIASGLKQWTLWMLYNGTVVNLRENHHTILDFQEKRILWSYVQVEGEGRISTKKMMIISVLAKSVEHAIKIANEKRAIIIANNEWPK